MVGAFTAALIFLALFGKLGAVYEYIYRTFPGRPLTYVMRQYPWVYGIGALVILGLLLWGTNIETLEGRVRVFTVWAVFLVGFLGGHVLWGSSGPGYSWCDTDRFDIRVDPHERATAPAQADDAAIEFHIKVGSRTDSKQLRSAWEIDIDELLTSFSAIAPSSFDEERDVERIWVQDDPAELAVIIRPGGPVAAGEAKGPVVVTDTTAEANDRDRSCERRRPYIIEVEQES